MEYDQVGFVLGDMANPEGDLPIVITSAMSTVIVGFCLMNAAIYVILPFETIRTSTTVAVVSPPPNRRKTALPFRYPTAPVIFSEQRHIKVGAVESIRHCLIETAGPHKLTVCLC